MVTSNAVVGLSLIHISCQLCGKAGQEGVLGLLRGQDGDRGQNAEGVSRQEDHVLSCGSRRNGAHDVLDVVDGVGHTGVLGARLVSEVDVTLGIQSDVLQPVSYTHLYSQHAVSPMKGAYME